MTATVRGISVDGRAGVVKTDATNEYTVVYRVTTDDRNDGPAAVEAAFGIPDIGDYYAAGNDSDVTAICTGKNVTQTESPWEWDVSCTYTNSPIDIRVITAQQVDNPLNMPAEISYGFQQRSIRIPGYYNDPGNPPSDQAMQVGVYAPNGELFEPQPEMEIYEPVLTIKRNVSVISGQAMMAMANAVNSDSWQNADPRQLKLAAPQATRKYHVSCGFYWEVQYSIAFRWDTWDVQILNQGTYYWSGGKPDPVTAANYRDSSKFKRIMRDGAVVTVNLTTNGDINETGVPTFTRLRVFRELNFGSLGLI